jgi:glycosyltransferase involved in cell wall biosynthesis
MTCMAHKESSKKKIALYVTGNLGGTETFIVNLTSFLKTLGWESYVLVNMLEGHRWSEYFKKRGIEVKNLPFRFHEDPKGKNYILDALYEIQADIYIPNCDHVPHSVLPELLNTKTISVMIVHGPSHENIRMAALFAKYARGIVAISQTMRDIFQGIAEIPNDRVHYIPTGIPMPNNFAKKLFTRGTPIRVIYPGRMDRWQKRAWRYIDLAYCLIDRNVNFKMLLLGDGTERLAMLKAINESSTLSKYVQIRQGVPPESVSSFLVEHDVFVLLSDFEGLSVALLEAMSHGLVPIASNVSGNIDVIRSGENGYLVPAGDVDMAAKYIEQLSLSPELYNLLALQAYKDITDHFSISRMIQQYNLLFNRLIAER